jgi:hypothetical protein
MKKILLITVFAVLLLAPFTSIEAQIEIPAYNVELTGSTITFEENHPPLPFMSAEERKLNVDAIDNSPSTTASINIIVYKLDATIVYGPYTVYEGSVFDMDIDENEWGVDIISYSSGAIASVWFE